MKRKRAVSVSQLLKTNLYGLEFAGEWLDAIGRPELTGTWLIWGNSGNGKTRFALQLAKYLTTFGLKVAYDSLEEGVSLSLRTAIADTGMQEASRRFILLDKEPVGELIDRLSERRSADVVIIDSVQYTGMKYSDYKIMRDKFRNKLFILVSHAEGKLPEGRVAKSIRFDAMVKIWVEGYMAYSVSRYGGGEPYIIWEEGAEKCLHPKET